MCLINRRQAGRLTKSWPFNQECGTDVEQWHTHTHTPVHTHTHTYTHRHTHINVVCRRPLPRKKKAERTAEVFISHFIAREIETVRRKMPSDSAGWENVSLASSLLNFLLKIETKGWELLCTNCCSLYHAPINMFFGQPHLYILRVENPLSFILNWVKLYILICCIPLSYPAPNVQLNEINSFF